jgi:hypothetical protein
MPRRCKYQGLFDAFGDVQQSEDWVKSNRIVAYYAIPGKTPTYQSMKLKYLLVRNPANPSKTLKVEVVDTCSDGDTTNNDCTRNANKGGGTLIDFEYYTAAALYDGQVSSNDYQAIEWQLA